MTKGNGSTSDVHLLVWDLEDIFAVDGHGGESLVNLDDVAVIDSDVVFGEELGDGDGRADTHDTGGQTGNGGTDILGENWLSEFDGAGALHEENGSGCK